MANRGWKAGKQHRGLGCSPGTSICCWGRSAWGLSTAAIARGHCWRHPEQGTALMCLEGQILVGSARSRASLSQLQHPEPCRPWIRAPDQKLLTGKTGWPCHCKRGVFCGLLSHQCWGIPVPCGGSPSHGTGMQLSPFRGFTSLCQWVDTHAQKPLLCGGRSTRPLSSPNHTAGHNSPALQPALLCPCACPLCHSKLPSSPG